MAKPTKCNEQTTKRVVQALETGAYIETAAAYAGIGRQTLYDWLRKGRKAIEADQQSVYREFVDAMDLAMAKSELADLTTIAKFADGFKTTKTRVERTPVFDADGKLVGHGEKVTTEEVITRSWQAAAWRLERKHPQKWGRRMELTGKDGQPLGGGESGPMVVVIPDNNRGDHAVASRSRAAKDSGGRCVKRSG